MIDASGCYVMPGFIDLHVHLQRSGTGIQGNTGRQAEERRYNGGVTTICAMPNTKPVIGQPGESRS